MVLGIGIDLVEVRRLADAIEAHGERLLARIFTDGERADCGGRLDPTQGLAARFAAKEACLKALGTGWSGGLTFRQVEVVARPGGAPELRLSGKAQELALARGVERAHVSLTHQPGVAAAVVVLEGRAGTAGTRPES